MFQRVGGLRLLPLVVGLLFSGAVLAATGPTEASAATECLSKVTKYGKAALAYDNSDQQVVRSSSKVVFCVKRASRAYYISSASCTPTWARLRDWDLSRLSSSSQKNNDLTSFRCVTSSSFKRVRSIHADEYACHLSTWDQWKIDTSNGTLTRTFSTPGLEIFEPGSCDSRSVDGKPDTTAPVLGKPVATLGSPTSRSASYTLNATDNKAVTQMRVKATGDADWRPWVAYSPSGTVVLPDRFGAFTVWFQVRDAAGNLSSQRASDTLTRVQDTAGPTVTGASISKADETSRYVQYSLAATDDYSGVTQMRVLVSGEDWRPWVAYNPGGTVILPDGWGRFGITFQVMDGAGNISATRFAGAATRTAAVTPVLRQIDNNGTLRSCGSTPATACSAVVKKFRTTISSAVLPDTNLLLKAWRDVNGVWVESSVSPFLSEPINGRTTIDMAVTANLLAGVWRFQAQVPRDPEDVTAFGASEYQYLRIG